MQSSFQREAAGRVVDVNIAPREGKGFLGRSIEEILKADGPVSILALRVGGRLIGAGAGVVAETDLFAFGECGLIDGLRLLPLDRVGAGLHFQHAAIGTSHLIALRIRRDCHPVRVGNRIGARHVGDLKLTAVRVALEDVQITI